MLETSKKKISLQGCLLEEGMDYRVGAGGCFGSLGVDKFRASVKTLLLDLQMKKKKERKRKRKFCRAETLFPSICIRMRS